MIVMTILVKADACPNVIREYVKGLIIPYISIFFDFPKQEAKVITRKYNMYKHFFSLLFYYDGLQKKI